jgi:hypothetical protein
MPARRRGTRMCAGRHAGGIPCLLLRRGAECCASGRVAQGKTAIAPPQPADLGAIPSGEDSLSHIFDRAWAKAVVREAAERQAVAAAERGDEAVRRVELLRLRFHEEMPIREIARLWGVDSAVLHHEYARARREFLASLRDVVASHRSGSHEAVEDQCAQLLSLLE